MLISVKAFPSSGRSEVAGKEGSLKVYLKGRAEGGKANRELVLTLARHFGVTPGQIHIKSGSASRNKTVLIEGVKQHWAQK